MADSSQTPAIDAQDRWLLAAGYLVALVRKLVIAVEQRAVSDFWATYAELLEWHEKYRERAWVRDELLSRARGNHRWQDIPAELVHDIPGVLALEAVDRVGDPLPWRAVPDTVRGLLGINVSTPTLLALINLLEGEHNRAFHEAAGASAGQVAEDLDEMSGEAKAPVEPEAVTDGGTTGNGVISPNPKPVAKSAAVTLFGPELEPVVQGKKKPLLSLARYNVVMALIKAGTTGLTKDKLDEKSGHPDARKIMRNLANSDSDWKAVLVFPGLPGVGYRIK